MKNKKRFAIAALAAILLFSGGYYIYVSRTSVSAANSYQLADAKIGNVTKVVSATGTLQNSNYANLSFGSSGRLSKLNVKLGDAVKKGAVLAELDKTVLQNQVQSAAANVKSAQAKLNQLQQGPTSAETVSQQAQVTRAQIDLETAKRNLETARQNADPAYLDNQINTAAQELAIAQKNYDNISKSGNQTQVSMAKMQLDQANKNYSAAVAAKSDITQGQTQLEQAQNTVRSAQAAYDSAVAQMNSNLQPANASDIEQAQASVQQAQSSLSTAETNLEQATLTASFDGLITAVNVREGEQAGGSTAALTIQSSETGMQLQVPIDEADIGLIKVGQQATANVDALPGQIFSASVTQIAPTGTTQNNVTTFAVTLSITGDTSQLKVGQSMTANILIEQKTNVLIVPSEAVRGLKSKHTVLVYKSENEQPVSVDVQTGLDDGVVTEITGGLAAGQKVVVGTTSAGNSNNANRSSNPLGSQMGKGLGGSGLGGAVGGGGSVRSSGGGNR